MSDDWKRVDEERPVTGVLLETYHEDESNGARATNVCYFRQLRDPWSGRLEDGEWCEPAPPFGSGRTTVTHNSFLPPTHWRLARPRDLGIELNREQGLAFGNYMATEPAVPPISLAGKSRLVWWAAQLATMAAALKQEAADYGAAGMEMEKLLTVRLQLSVEETGEWAEALAYGNIVKAFNELVDMSVVTDGHYLTLGLADLKPAGYREVMGANMSKLVDGKPMLSPAGRHIKGPEYRKPDLARVLREAKDPNHQYPP